MHFEATAGGRTEPDAGTDVRRGVVPLVLLTLAVGIPVDASGAWWAQPLVSLWTWGALAWIAAAAPAAERRALAACVVLATAGELFLKDVWGLYEYRLHNLPLFIPAGHALVYAAATRMSAGAPRWLPGAVAAGFAGYAAGAALTGVDTFGLPWLVGVPGVSDGERRSPAVRHPVPVRAGDRALWHRSARLALLHARAVVRAHDHQSAGVDRRGLLHPRDAGASRRESSRIVANRWALSPCETAVSRATVRAPYDYSGWLPKGMIMEMQRMRRDILRGGLAAAGLGVIGVPEWVLPALAQGATVVPFLDFPDTFNANPAPDRRLFDSRTLTSFTTPKDQFFTTQHYGHPVLDEATFKLQVSGLVNAPKAFSLDDLKKMPKGEVMFGFECSGNRAPVQGLCSNGKWTGVPLAALLKTRWRQGQRPRVRLPRRRPRRGRGRVAHPEVQARPAVRPQHAA